MIKDNLFEACAQILQEGHELNHLKMAAYHLENARGYPEDSATHTSHMKKYHRSMVNHYGWMEKKYNHPEQGKAHHLEALGEIADDLK